MFGAGSTYPANGGPPIEDDEDQMSEFVDWQKIRAGFVAINREIRNHWLVGFGQRAPKAMDDKRPQYAKSEAWMDLIMECQYRAGSVNNNGRRMELKPGQLLGAVSWLADRWNWTPKAVRYFLDQLEEEGMITRSNGEQDGVKTETLPNSDRTRSKKGNKKGKFASVLTICKYSLYQLGANSDWQVEGSEIGKLGAIKGQVKGNIIRKEQRNKETNKKIGPSADDVRWAHARWNDLADKVGLPNSPKLTPSLEKNIRARLREHGRDGWESALRKVYDSAFLQGKNDRGFTASLPWFAGPQNFDKVASGSYSGKQSAPKTRQQSVEDASRDAFMDSILNGRS
jgi:DNA-binding transcriptional regulator YhcF (GntR family)